MTKLIAGAAVLAAACLTPSDAFSAGSLSSLRPVNTFSAINVRCYFLASPLSTLGAHRGHIHHMSAG
jgi:hypothetical protein